MSTEDSLYDSLHFGHQDITSSYDNATSCYDNATSSYERFLPEVDTTQPSFYLPQADYLEVLPQLQPGGFNIPPPCHNNSGEGTFPRPVVMTSSPPEQTNPKEVVIPLPQPNNNNQQIIQHPPEFFTPQISEPTAPEAVFPLPPPTMIPGMMPPLQYPQNCSVSNPPMLINTVQPMMMATHTTVVSTQPPPCKDYLPWSIVNLMLCCFIFGAVALILSIQTRSAKKYQDWEKAKKKSRLSFGFNLASTLLGIVIVGIIVAVYFFVFRSYYSSSSYYYG